MASDEADRCRDCAGLLTLDDCPGACEDCSQRVNEAFERDVPWVGLSREEECRRRFRGGWASRAALAAEQLAELRFNTEVVIPELQEELARATAALKAAGL